MGVITLFIIVPVVSSSLNIAGIIIPIPFTKIRNGITASGK